MKIRRRLVLTVAFLLTLGLGAVAVVSSATPASRVITFVDQRRGLSLSMELEPAAPDLGHFILRVPGTGVYSGNAGAGLRELTPTSVVVHFDGPAELRAFEGVGPRVPQSVTVSLQAQLDPAHHTAEATLAQGTLRLHLVASAVSAGGIDAVLGRFDTALVADDGGALYDLLTTDYTRKQTRSAFAAEWVHQSAQVGRIVATRRTALGAVTTSDLGVSTIKATYEITVMRPGAATATLSMDAIFLRQDDSWRLWFTSEPN